MRSIDVYLCRAIKPHDEPAELDALWTQLAADYNNALSDEFRQCKLRNGQLNFNKKIIGEA